MFFVAGTVALNIIYEGLLLMVLLINYNEKVASSKKPTQFKTSKNAKTIPYLRPIRMTKIDTLFMTKTVKSHTL